MTRSASFVRLFVGFTLIATGVPASCPIEVSPASVVVRYGDPLSINCSTTVIQYEKMGWETTEKEQSQTKGNHLIWAVENLTSWDILATCYLTLLPENPMLAQCSKATTIILYTFPEVISISSNSIMKEKEEKKLTCHIHHVAPVQNLTVRWYKEDALIHTDTFDNPIKTPVDQTSVYSFTLTRQDNGVPFRCEAHMDLRPEGPQLHASSQGYNIAVWFGPDIKCPGYNLNVMEGETLASHCSVEGNPPPTVEWTKNGNKIDPHKPLTRENAGQYVINAEGAFFVKRVLQVTVLYGPELKCPNSYTALEYTPHNPICTAEGYPEPKMTWYRDGEEVEFPEILTRRETGQYLVRASNDHSSVNLTVEITIEYPPSQIVELEDSEVEVGSDVWLKCSSMGNPRPKYVWNYNRGANVMEVNEDGVSRLFISNATVYNTGSYTCHATNEKGNVSKTARVTVKGATAECPIKITPDRMVAQYQGTVQAATCKPTSISAAYLKERYWQVEGTKIPSESWHVNTSDGWNLKPYCTGEFQGIGTCQIPLNFTLYKIPDGVFIRAVPRSSSLVEGEELQLQCDITQVAPAQNVAVRWYQGNESLIEGSTPVNVCLQENGTNCDIRSPIDVSSAISITVDRKHNGAEIRCEAQMDLGPEGPQPPPKMTSSPLNITVHYKPTINQTKLPKTIPVFRGYDEELVCEADGQPPPKTQWLYTSKMSHVSEGKLIVSEAGFYNCTATNEVDSVFYVVEVILEEDYLPLIAGFVAVIVVAISIIFVFIYSIYYKNTKMRRYSLKNPKPSPHSGNVAHNGWDLQFPMTILS